MSDFAALRAALFEDRAAVLRLSEAASMPELLAAVAQFAEERGLSIVPGELEAVAQMNRRAWLERWLD